MSLWTPSSIETALWLDASDASTITLESGAVSAWADKSGNTRHGAPLADVALLFNGAFARLSSFVIEG